MTQNNKKSTKNFLVILIIITASLIFYSCSKNPSTNTQKPVDNEQKEQIPPPGTSFGEYYKTSSLYFNELASESPKELGFKIITKINVGCHLNEDTPCGHYIFIISKDDLQPENQEFYLAQDKGHYYGDGYAYFGPFYDNIERIVNESKEVKKTW